MGDRDNMVYLVIAKTNLDDYHTIPFSYDEAVARQYIKDLDMNEAIIRPMTVEAFKRLGELKHSNAFFDEILPFDDDVFLTDSEIEFLDSCIDQDLMDLINHIKVVRRMLRYFKGGEAKQLRKDLYRFIHNKCKDSELDKNNCYEQDILYEKINMRKYSKKCFKSIPDE